MIKIWIYNTVQGTTFVIPALKKTPVHTAYCKLSNALFFICIYGFNLGAAFGFLFWSTSLSAWTCFMEAFLSLATPWCFILEAEAGLYIFNRFSICLCWVQYYNNRSFNNLRPPVTSFPKYSSLPPSSPHLPLPYLPPSLPNLLTSLPPPLSPLTRGSNLMLTPGDKYKPVFIQNNCCIMTLYHNS